MNIDGFEDVIRSLKSFGEAGERRIAAITAVTAQEVAADAARRAPVSKSKSGSTGGTLRQSINATMNDPLNWWINVNAPYGAYVEFGTGALVEIPEEWKDLAYVYYVNGQGYMYAQPYLYPAYIDGRNRYYKDLEDSLSDLIERSNRK